MKINFAKADMPTNGALAVFATDKAKLTDSARQADDLTGGALSRALANARYKGGRGEILEIVAPSGTDISRILLVGLGESDGLKLHDLETIGGKICAQILTSGDKSLSVFVDGLSEDESLPAADAAAHLAVGLKLRGYRFDKYRTKEPKDKKPSLTKATILTADPAAAKKSFKMLDSGVTGVFLTRDLTSEPANVLYPESFAHEAKKLVEDGVEVEVLGDAEMSELGMNALLAVGRGSIRESQLVIMKWNGGAKKDKPVVLVGKGVTFDTGGISIKPAEGMEQMKWDMGGAGIVTGTMKALAARKAKVNAIGIIGLVENMPSGNAQRPGDVVTSMSGQTIEVINTDAEGRLVLCDALTYAQEKFKPRVIVDLATLTGAMIISLGHEYAGFFTNDDTLADRLHQAGDATGDRVWRMPLGDAYDKLIESNIADMKNVGGRPAGSITAAQFLKRFIKDVPWAHIDVAGMVWAEKDSDLAEKGATGFGVRLLDRLIADNYQK